MNPIRINLLPHRQIRKAKQQRLFAILAVAALGAGLALVALGQAYLVEAKAAQDRRNAFLREEIAKLDQQIAEIAQLKEKTNDLLARKQAVESLQSNRDEAVRLFDVLARQLPEGMYLKSVKQSGEMVALSGFAQSSARVSSFMRALAQTELFDEPTLVEVKAAMVGNLRVNEFAMNVKISKQAAATEAKTPGHKGAKP
ncbi:MAG: PilN domain-containing protein [Thiobacillaceae bacterium]|jgi:type IV pilus assembly protein PilN|nr:PilN domain-containing protein [Thiobacillaceae bacterium]